LDAFVMSIPETLEPPNCERCGDAMATANRVPKLGSHPELVTFRCDGCGHVLTVEETGGA
jgi:uncharacterized Zn finger protein